MIARLLVIVIIIAIFIGVVVVVVFVVVLLGPAYYRSAVDSCFADDRQMPRSRHVPGCLAASGLTTIHRRSEAGSPNEVRG